MTLTKTDFIAYIDSPKHLWAIKNQKLDKQEVDAYLEHLFEQGYDVEQYAEKYIQNNLILDYKASADDVVLQPTAIDGEFEARTDVLIKNPETQKWDMYEIKSGSSVVKQYKYDATFQYLVFSKKYNLGKIYILHLNSEYIMQGEINLEGLFQATDITESVEKLKDEVHLLRYEALDVLRESDPGKIRSCIRPKSCPCLDMCHPDLPDYSIYHVRNLTGNEKKIRELEDMGVKSIYDIPSDFKLSDKQSLQVQVAKDDEVYIDHDEVRSRIDGLEYPLYFIDYESFNPAIPIYDGFSPYNHIVFQWSLHVKRSGSKELEHYEFLSTENNDPIPKFLDNLREVLEGTGSIIVWNDVFEGGQNTRMGEIHPEYQTFCEDMNDRMFDLMKIFRDQIYVDSRFKGSYSIKKVLPVLVTDLSYEGMGIAEGATAMVSWKEMVFDANMDEEQREKIRKDLLEYCKLDTLAMVRIFEFLLREITNARR